MDKGENRCFNQPMFLLNENGNIVNAECSLSLFGGIPNVTVESSGGESKGRNVERRNPDYNKLLSLILKRLALAGIKITGVVLASKKVTHLPVVERLVQLDQPYPIDPALTDIDELRRMIGREVARMHQDPTATRGGNAQKRIQICLDRPVSVEQLELRQSVENKVEVLEEYAPGLNETEKASLRMARIGQGRFRQELLKAYTSKCPVTGIMHPHLLTASHIKPWIACTNLERLDPNNGILLSALVDRLFDRGLITFNDDGSVIISSELSPSDVDLCHLNPLTPIHLAGRRREYMEYHRTIQFKRD